MKKHVSRREFLSSATALAAAVPILGGAAQLPAPGSQQVARDLKAFRAWDVHSHMDGLPGDTPEERVDVLVQHMDRLGIERLILSQGYAEYDEEVSGPTPQQLRIENDRVMRAVRHVPNRAYGSVFLNPKYPDSCLEEFDRCVKNGPMVGVGEMEGYVLCSSPVFDPIVERAAAMKAPIIIHAWFDALGNEPGESTPYDVVELAKRHPEAQFICAHTGGNWDLGIRVIRNSPNVCAGIAGSDPTSGFVEMAVRELGAERVVYGSDVGGRSFASQIAKVIGANIPDAAKELIVGGNLRRIYSPILHAKGYSV
ncbi:MAG: amidohydrolase family protein [Terriglobia bacterium]